MIIWIANTQLDRRNINELTRGYLVGRRQIEEANERGRPGIENNSDTVSPLITKNGLTSVKIANGSKISSRTVYRNANFAEAIDTIVDNTKHLGISRKDILTGIIKGTMKDINALALLDPGTQQRVITLIKEKKESDVKDATFKIVNPLCRIFGCGAKITGF